MIYKSDTVELVFIHNEFVLRKYLNNKVQYNKKSYYLDFGTTSPIMIKSLDNAGIKKFHGKQIILNNREKFLEKYIKLIDDIGMKNNTRIWWASELASKNRFTSHLPELLFQYTLCTNALKHRECGILIILYPMQALKESLEHYLRSSNLRYHVHKHSLLERFNSFIRSINIRSLIKNHFLLLIIIRDALLIYYRSIRARQVINLDNNCNEYSQPFYLIKSHVYENSFDTSNKYIDNFFGRLPEYLSKKSKLIFFVHIFGNYNKVLKQINNNQSFQIIPFEYFISFQDIYYAIKQIQSGKIIIDGILFDDLDVTNILRSEFNRSGIKLYHWIIFESTRQLLSYYKFNSAYMTYENIAWENMFIQSINEHSPTTKIIGCQHTVIPQSASGMFIGRNEKTIKPIPDRIVTTGIETKNILESYGNYPGGLIKVGCALRYEYLNLTYPEKKQRTNSILVGIEGHPSVYKLVNYILKNIIENKKYKFIIRTHPILPWEKLKNKIHYDINKYDNVYLSDNLSLIKDLNKVDICIYWGSTVALESLSMGIPVIHFDMGTVFSYDPLFRCNALKWNISENDSLYQTIDNIYSITDDEYILQAQEAKNYIESHFYPVDENNLEKFIYY